jgi:hypothetical protein
MTEGRGQRTEGRGQRVEGRGQSVWNSDPSFSPPGRDDRFMQVLFQLSGTGGLSGVCNKLIEKENLKKRITNIEQGIMNVEVRYSIDLY